ncbi:MAG TPA: hypothetical protein VFB31_16375 [Pseudolabrys sp.]|nr:hypothetical protein [Pseudolabrys sp.]
MTEAFIHVHPIRQIPSYAEPLVRSIGLAYLRFGRLEQHLDFLLQSINDPRLVTGAIPKYPDTSFRLRVKLFKERFAQHPRFAHVHHIANPVVVGLRKANRSRVRLVHSNIQGFDEGPPPAIRCKIAKFVGRDVKTWDGNWTLQNLEDFNTLLVHLSDDLGKISALTMNEGFRQSLEKELSRTERATLWIQDRLRRMPRLRIERSGSLA